MIKFIHPRSPFLIDEGMMPPLGIMYLVAVLKKAGIEAQIVDLGVGDTLPDGDLYVTGTAAQTDEILALPLRSYRALGGPLASTQPMVMAGRFDCVVCGEAEDHIVQLATKKPGGLIMAPRIRDLDRLPFPDRTLCSKYNYTINGLKATVIITSHGCPNRCAFCCRTLAGGVFFRSAKNVLAEVDEIIKLGYQAICFYDDTVAADRQRLLDICDGLRDRKITWRCMLRADQTDPRLIKTMAQSGCHEAIFGVESGSQKILDGINKRENLFTIKQAMLQAKAAGIKVKASIVVGLPGETWDTVRETISFLRDTKPDFADINILSVYPGSDIYAHPENYSLSFEPGTFFKGHENEVRSTVSTPGMTAAEIQAARLLIKTEFEGMPR